jgi:hypothetical protein
VGISNSNVNNKNNRNSNNKIRSNRKGNPMAIVHVAMKSSSSAPPSAAHADYIARDGQYARRGGVELVESGNMPEFAQTEPRSFWVAADTHERANGRTYTELQIALPRELSDEKRVELARQAAREFMGNRFAYTLAVHNPVAKDKIEQPHMHLMFSERVIDERTRALPEEQFFKRNGAKKDRETWHDREKPLEIRERWCEMMNRAMVEENIDVRVDPRSWAEQGREDLAALVEPKELRGDGPDAVERREEITQRRELRQELPELHLDGGAAVKSLEQEAAAKIAQIESKLHEELNILERLIAKTKQVAKDLAEKARQALAWMKAPAAVVQPELKPLTAEETAEARFKAWEAQQEREAKFEDKYRAWEAKEAQKERAQQAREQQQIEKPEKSRGKDFGIER